MNTRILHLREKIKGLNLDGMIITSPINIKYLTNIDVQGMLLITKKENIFLTYTMYVNEVNSSITIDDDIVVVDVRELSQYDYESFFMFCENVGFEEGNITYDDYKKIKQKYKINNMAETEGIIEKQRLIKDKNEIEKIRKACEITDSCFSNLLTYIKSGMSEKQIAMQVERFFKYTGAEGEAFDTIVASGKNSSIPHWKPSDKKVLDGEPILIDMGCKYEGYCADMSRTIFISNISDEIKPIYELVLKNQRRVIEEIKSGESIKLIAKMVDNDFQFNKFNLIHGLGHGVGLEIHENPKVDFRNEGFLRENMVLTDEPGIYIPGKFGVRIEDTILVTNEGAEVLTRSKKEFTII